MTSTFTCPHCGNTNKVIPQKARSYDGFEHEAPTIVKAREGPVGAVRDLIHFLKGGRASFEPQADAKIVRIEEWNYRTGNVKLHDMDSRVTFQVVTEIAQMIAGGHEWTRDNLVKHTTVSENKTRIYQREFKRLGYLEVSANNRSSLTHTGRRFLNGVLKMGRNEQRIPLPDSV